MALLLAMPMAAKAAEDKPVETAYYPLKVGNTWTYKAGDTKIVVTVKKLEEVNKQSCARVEAANSNKIDLVEHVAVKDGSDGKPAGVYRYSAAGKMAKDPVCFLFLVKKGETLEPKTDETWQVDTKVGPEELKGSFKSGTVDELKVPAGTYKNVVTVTSQDLKANGQPVSLKYYFAKDVGMIKQVMTVGTAAEVVLELEKFVPAK
jgi:hypothetical protein